jgi:DNA modification methylase
MTIPEPGDPFVEQRTINPADLVPYEGNPNIGDVDAVRESLRNNGQYRTPVTRLLPDGRLQVLAGHTTRLAAIAEGLPLRVDVIDADDDAARRIVLADNRTAQLARYDEPLLLQLLDGGDLTGTGWDEAAYKELLDEHGGENPFDFQPDGDPDDFDEDPPPEPVTQPGDVWVLGPHRLVCGDSTDDRVWVTLLGGAQVDCVWTDPPYGVEYEGGTKDALRIQNDTQAGLTKLLSGALGAAFRASKPGAAWYVACADKGGCFDQFLDVLTELGVYRHQIIWVKDRFVLGHGDYHFRHEPVLYGWHPGAARLHPVEDRTQDTVWEIPRPQRSEDHPTMKPVELVTRALRNSTGRGWVVADPFGGSGTTLIAAHIEGRVARLIELGPGYCDVIGRRWQELTGEMPVLERTGEPVDLIGAAAGAR